MKVKLPVITTEIIDEYIGKRFLEYDMENLQWTWTQDAVDFACLIAAAPTPEPSEVESLRQGIQDYLDGNYPNPRTLRPNACPHDNYRWQECTQCDEDHFLKLLNPQ